MVSRTYDGNLISHCLWPRGPGLPGSVTSDSLPEPQLPAVLPGLGTNRGFLKERGHS